MSRHGGQGEHIGGFSVRSSHVLGRDRKTGSLLTLLTPETRVGRPALAPIVPRRGWSARPATGQTSCRRCHERARLDC
jgi:hypothetical protein